MTRNGKIARLPKVMREQLNRRLDDNEPGKQLVAWLNSQAEVQAIITTEFGGKPIREQNLSEWKQGGYRDWQRHQERHELIRQLGEEAAELGTVMECRAVHRHLSAVLTADLALAARDLMEQTTDPLKRAQCLGQLVGKFAQLRREESNAGRVQVVREHWERKLAKEKEYERAGGEFMPGQALLLQRMYIEMYGRRDGLALAPDVEDGTGLFPDAATALTGKPSPTESDLIRPLA